MEIRRIRADEGTFLRELRLQALTDSPDAFESTLADEEAQPPEFWNGRAERGALGYGSVILFAEEDGRCLGTATGLFTDDLAGLGVLVALWVRPEERRKGIARRLLAEVERWSASRSMKQLRLWVADTNAPAKALFLGSAYNPSGVSRPLPSNPSIQEIMMLREL